MTGADSGRSLPATDVPGGLHDLANETRRMLGSLDAAAEWAEAWIVRGGDDDARLALAALERALRCARDAATRIKALASTVGRLRGPLVE